MPQPQVELSLRNLKRLAKQGNPKAQDALGGMYFEGLGVQQDYAKARFWWEKATQQGHASAQFNLGVMYAEGRGVLQDYKIARKWFEKAAQQGLAVAQNNLAGMYAEGQGVPQDYKIARELWEKAALLGHASAQGNLGVMYEHGRGVQRSFPKAFEWFEKAAQQEYTAAQVNLAILYEDGKGCTQSDTQAFQWYKKASDKGHSVARFSLIFFYFTGKGIEKNLPLAKQICQKATSLFTLETLAKAGWDRKSQHNFERQWFRVNKGTVPRMRKYVSSLPKEQRKEHGLILEELNNKILAYNRAVDAYLDEQDIQKLFSEYESADLEGKLRPVLKQGSIHPLTAMEWRTTDYFIAQNFDVADGPEIETEKYNFDDLNIPPHHPAREMHDTFYVNLPKHPTQGRYLLRTHTSPVQIREMLKRKTPPFRLISHGRVYRCDSDRTHTPMFHQMEGLVIEKGIHMGHMRWLIEDFLKTIFKKSGLTIRLRPSYFPFTEPSVEVDMRFSAQSPWLEVAGCGMVHPNVLRNCHVDPKEWQGFAFGFGLDRLTMLHSGCQDLRAFFRSDVSINVPFDKME